MDEKLHEFLPGKPGDSRERIQDLLREKCMTQAELAEKTGMSESALSRYISGLTDKLSTENIVAIAKVFGITTDFLLCLSDIPFTTNYDIEKLGLTVGAAEKLLKRKVDPLIVSQLIVSPPFALLVTQLARLRDDTYAAGFAYMTEMLRGMSDLFTEHIQSNPEDRQAAKKVMEDLRLLRATPYQVQTEALHETLDKIVEDFKKGSDSYMQEMQKLTSKVMTKITSNLKAQMKNPEKLRSVTPEMMVASLVGAMDHLELNDEQKEQFRNTLLPLFTKPQIMIYEEKASQSEQID